MTLMTAPCTLTVHHAGQAREGAGERAMNALDGIRIVSFNHFLMGPAGMQFLADLGADVIAVEPLEGAFQRKWGGVGSRNVDGQTMLFITANRNKRSLALDLKHERGREIARKLIARCDVVAENYRPGVMDSLGLGYEACKAINPQVVYAAGTGFGPDGPYSERPGQDLIIQAMSGLAAITGTRQHGPRAVGVSAVDHHAAALLAAGILAALLRRSRTGVGGRVDVSLLSAAIDLQMESFTCYLNGDPAADVRQPYPVAGWYFEAPYGIYSTSDGHLAVSLCPLEQLQRLVGVPEQEIVREAEAYSLREAAARRIGEAFATSTTGHWVGLLTRHNIWHSVVNDYRAVVEDPQVKHNGSFVKVESATGSPLTLVGHPVRYDGQAPGVRLAPQPLGAQTAEILREIGYSDADVDGLIAGRVVAARG